MKLWGKQEKVGGLIACYDLTEWWFSTFTEEERKLIDERYQPLSAPTITLTQGKASSSQLVTDFLNVLATWFRSPQDASIAKRIHSKVDELGRINPVAGPGYYNGRHFTTYVTDVKALKKDGRLDEAEKLLLELVAATEAEDKVDKCGVAPWYYEELAKIYRKRKEYAQEIAILERFASQRHAPGASPPKLIERLEKAKQLLHHAELHPHYR